MSTFIQRPGQAGNGRMLSPMWDDCPRAEIRHDPGAGYFFEDDFMQDFTLTGRYTLTQATQGTFAILDQRDGVAELDANSTTQHQGAQIQAGSTVGERFAVLDNTSIWFEASILLKDIATVPNIFLGLHDIDTTILSSGALVDASNDWIGFKCETAVSTLLGTCSNNTTESVTSTLLTLSSTYDGDVNTDGSAWLKLGFKVTNDDKIEFWVNGAKSSSSITSNIPSAALVPSFVCQTDGTVDPIMWIDRVDCYVLDRRKAITRVV